MGRGRYIDRHQGREPTAAIRFLCWVSIFHFHISPSIFYFSAGRRGNNLLVYGNSNFEIPLVLTVMEDISTCVYVCMDIQ